MEKQVFLMEVIDLSNKYNSSIKEEFEVYMKDSIRNVAKVGNRIFHINSFQWYFPVNGVNKIANAENILEMKKFLENEGFAVVDIGGQLQITW